MVKKALLIAACTLFLHEQAFSQYSERTVTYNGLGAGGQVSFVATEWYGPAFGFGFHGVLELLLGRFGTLQYNPSICMYFKYDRSTSTTGNIRTEIENHNSQVALNLFDVRYFFPLPSSLFIRPYAGLGLCIVINNTRQEITVTDLNTTLENYREDPNSNGDPGMNLFAGIDFPVNKVFVPYVETRITGSPNFVFRLTGGVTFRF